MTACVTVSMPTERVSTPHFVTSTLPPAKIGTPPPALTASPAPATGAAITTKLAQCKNGAVLLEDVTIPDNSNVPAGKVFTKTWKFKNTGTCPWAGFMINYNSGERMNAPASVPVPDTEAGGTVDISVDLTAPVGDGTYTIYFSLQSAAGESLRYWHGEDILRKGDCGYGRRACSHAVIIHFRGNTRCFDRECKYILQVQL